MREMLTRQQEDALACALALRRSPRPRASPAPSASLCGHPDCSVRRRKRRPEKGRHKLFFCLARRCSSSSTFRCSSPLNFSASCASTASHTQRKKKKRKEGCTNSQLLGSAEVCLLGCRVGEACGTHEQRAHRRAVRGLEDVAGRKLDRAVCADRSLPDAARGCAPAHRERACEVLWCAVFAQCGLAKGCACDVDKRGPCGQ